MPSAFNQHYEKILTFLENNAQTETTVHLTYAKATFFSMFSEETGADESLKMWSGSKNQEESILKEELVL